MSSEPSSDLEAQTSLLSGSGDPKIVVGEFFEKPTSTLAPDGAIKTIHKSGQASFLIWTIVNTLATIGIVKKPSELGKTMCPIPQ